MTWRVEQADCIEAMRAMSEASVDAICTDAPYGLGFMGKAWDDLPPGDEFAREALRVLKPGGHLLAFGGTRTSHRLTCAIEDAGFEIRDTIMWLYGSGFPKSLDVSKAIDKAAGAEGRWRKEDHPGRAGVRRRNDTTSNFGQIDYGSEGNERHVYEPSSPEAERWQGWGTALKPAHEPIIVARKPLSGTVAQTVLEHGTGALNVDGCRVGHTEGNLNRGGSFGGVFGNGGDVAAASDPSGRWPPNVALSHSASCLPVGTRRVKGHKGYPNGPKGNRFSVGDEPDGSRTDVWQGHADPDGTEEVEAWECVEGCPVAELDRQSGELKSGALGPENVRRSPNRIYREGMSPVGQAATSQRYAPNSGGASRFFYVAKASRRERNAGLEGFEEQLTGVWGNGDPANLSDGKRITQGKANVHPTVKPIALMRWLVRLVTPPGGTVLDPFAGSGTTGIVCVLEGFDFIGIEREAEYAEIAEARIAHWEREELGRPLTLEEVA